MPRAMAGRGTFETADGAHIYVTLGIYFGGGEPPRIDVAAIDDPERVFSVPAIELAAKVFLWEVTRELRRQAYRSRPFSPDPKPKHRSVKGKRQARA